MLRFAGGDTSGDNELMKNVKEAIALQLEGENPAAFGLAPDASILASYELETEPQAHA
jgi:hypothetical protein